MRTNRTHEVLAEIAALDRPWLGEEVKCLAGELLRSQAVEEELPLIVNAGLLKAGKSTLFNALSGVPGRFAVAESRCTVRAEREDCERFVLVDTPGADCRDADRIEAEGAYRKADLLLYVHSLSEGELAVEEVALLEHLATAFPDQAERSRRVVLVLSKAEKCEDVEAARKSIIVQVERYLGAPPSKVFVTACDRWAEGVERSRPGLKEKSGIPALRKFLESQVDRLRAGAASLSEERLRVGLERIDGLLREQETEAKEQFAQRVAEIDRDAEQARADLRRIFAN